MREEYPRPDFVRSQWMNLNGTWDFYLGEEKREIEVPFVCQCKRSGIGERIQEDSVVYERRLHVPDQWKEKRILLNFGAVDYFCRVWINGHCAGTHTGGQSPFSFDITGFLSWEEEIIRVEVKDWLKDEKIARGKQFWEEESDFIWYTPSTGIWQTVWLEPVSESRFQWVRFTPDIDEGTVRVDFELTRESSFPCRVELMITQETEVIFKGTMECSDSSNSITLDVFKKKALNGSFHFTGAYWTPENPRLYQAEMVLKAQGEEADRVTSLS